MAMSSLIEIPKAVSAPQRWPWDSGVRGESSEARQIENALRRVIFGEEQSRCSESHIISRTEQAISELYKAYLEAAIPGWHGGEGDPVTIETFAEAARFLQLLPEDILPDDVYAEPDGDLALEWYAGKGKLVIVSFDGKRRAIYRIRISDNEKSSGQFPLDAEVPDFVLSSIRKLLSNAART